MLSTFLTQLQSHPVIATSPRDARIIESLRSTFKRQRKFYNHLAKQQPMVLPSRKDSAIGLSSCRNSALVEDMKWTTKVKQTLKRSISQSFACNCKSKDTSHSDTTVNTVCMMHTETTPHRLFKYSIKTIPTPPYKSLILKYKSEMIAQQFCLIEHEMLQKVRWDELVELRWRKRSSKRASFSIDLTDIGEGDGVDRLIGFFNMVYNEGTNKIGVILTIFFFT